MTEIPEHLLRRSRERRAALGLGGGEGESGAAAALPATSGSPAAPASGAPASSTAVEPAAAAAAPAVVEEPVPVVTYIAPKGPHKTRVPIWVMPVLAGLPLWAALYPGAFGNHHKTAVVDPLVVGQQVYHSAGCSGCHGGNGEGGVGPALHGGQSKVTFPNVADQVKWVQTGSQSLKTGTPYGDPNRTGGQRTVLKSDMPGFSSSLTPTEIQDVVLYERNQL